MSRIDVLQPGQTRQSETTATPGRPEGAQSFQEMLAQANRLEAATAPADSVALDTTFATTQAAQAAETLVPGPLDPLEVEGMLRAERTLDILNAYQQGLGDRKKTLKELGGLVKAMDQEVAELTKVMERMQPGQPLYGLLSEVAVTAMVESVKFNRGDYVPAAAPEKA